MTKVVPFLRVADAEASAEWYARLGFAIEWRTASQPHLPLFIAISNGRRRGSSSPSTRGDARPDTLLYLYVDDVDAVAAEFGATVELAYYGMREIELTDPDGNRLRIGTPAAGDGPQELVPLARARSSATTRAAARASRPAIRSSRGRSGRPTTASARTCSARRPGSSRARSGCRGAAAPARRCAAGSGSRATSSTRRSTAPR